MIGATHKGPLLRVTLVSDMSDPVSQADELRTLEEKSGSTELTPQEEAPHGALAEEAASGPAAPGELPDPLPEAMSDAALFGDPDPGVSSWMGTPDVADAPEGSSSSADPLTEAGTTLPWDPTSPPPGSLPHEMLPQRYGDAAWDLNDPDIAVWVSWCEEQGLDPYDPDLLAWANWYYQEQLEGRASQEGDAAPVPDALLAEQSSPDEWSSDTPEEFADALQAEGPGSFGLPASDLSAVLTPAEEDEQTATPASLDDEAAGALASFDAEPAASANDFGFSADDDLGPILEVGVDVFEVFDDELADPSEDQLAAPSEWVPSEAIPSESAPSEWIPREAIPSEPVPSESASSGSSPSEPIAPEPELPVLDAAAFGMVALDSQQQSDNTLFDLEQAAASLAAMEAALEVGGSATSVAHDSPASAEQGGYAAQESELGPAPAVEATNGPEAADASPPTPTSGSEPTSSFAAEPAPPTPSSEVPATEQESGAEPAHVAGIHRVVIHTVEGEVKRGTVTDIVLEGRDVSLELQSGETESLPPNRIRAVFFMADAGESPPAPEGKRVRVTFRDGRQVAGFSNDYAPERCGFFVVPADERSHTARIWVYRAAVRQISIT